MWTYPTELRWESAKSLRKKLKEDLETIRVGITLKMRVNQQAFSQVTFNVFANCQHFFSSLRTFHGIKNVKSENFKALHKSLFLICWHTQRWRCCATVHQPRQFRESSRLLPVDCCNQRPVSRTTYAFNVIHF